MLFYSTSRSPPNLRLVRVEHLWHPVESSISDMTVTDPTGTGTVYLLFPSVYVPGQGQSSDDRTSVFLSSIKGKQDVTEILHSLGSVVPMRSQDTTLTQVLTPTCLTHRPRQGKVVDSSGDSLNSPFLPWWTWMVYRTLSGSFYTYDKRLHPCHSKPSSPWVYHRGTSPCLHPFQSPSRSRVLRSPRSSHTRTLTP